jgi:dipeptidyl-peptidase 4
MTSFLLIVKNYKSHDPEMFLLVKKLWGDQGPDVEATSRADAAESEPLTLERIFSSDDFRSESAPAIKWLENGAYTTLAPSDTVGHGTDIVRVDSNGHKEVLVSAGQLVPPGSKDALSIHGYELSNDLDVALIYTQSVRVWRQNTRGDYWTFHRSSGKLTKLGGESKPSILMFAKLSPDGQQVGYVRENNLYVEPSGGGEPTALTTDGADDIINGTFDWVYEEEFGCRDGWRWSADGKQIAYWQLDTSDVKKFTLIDSTSENYPRLKSFAYPKTGEKNAVCRIGVVSTAGGSTQWIKIPGDTRSDFYLPRMEWIGKSHELVIHRINRLQNAVDVIIADTKTAETRTVWTDRDNAWVDIHDDAMSWVDNGSAFTWISEKNGWRQPYFVSRDGATARRVLNADFDVIQLLRIDENAGRIYFLASPNDATQQYLFAAKLNSDEAPVQLTPAEQAGTHEYQLSPECGFAVHTYSTFEMPPRSELISLPDHKVVRTLTTNDRLINVVKQLRKSPVEFLKVKVDEGVELDGWLMKPASLNEGQAYPLVLHVYGEPASQSVRDRWGGQNYLWHLMLAQRGYAVACFDNRGTPCPRGRDWRKAAYRRVGVLASEDQSAAVKELLKRPDLDASRVGAWGWSGGGSMTLNLLFRYPDLFHTGIAVASVPDMRLYDTIYQERYMGLPQDNPDDYRRGSPITHAEGLKGNLLIVHGTGDDNCHPQGMEKLTNRLIELNKPFSQMFYPNRSHSISEGHNTSLHLYSLMTRYLESHLPVSEESN